MAVEFRGARPSRPLSSGAVPRPRRVLVVVDDEHRASTLVDALSTDWGQDNVDVASPDAAAIASAFILQPELIVIDRAVSSGQLRAALLRAAPGCRLVVSPA